MSELGSLDKSTVVLILIRRQQVDRNCNGSNRHVLSMDKEQDQVDTVDSKCDVVEGSDIHLLKMIEPKFWLEGPHYTRLHTLYNEG